MLIVEVMGRHAGWIALHAGMAGGANVILIPESPFDIDKVCAYVEHRFQTRYAPIVVVAEGAHPAEGDDGAPPGELDAFGHVRLGGIGAAAGRRRSRSAPARRPAARCSATSSAAARRPRSTGCSRPGSACRPIDAVHDGDFGKMVALRGTDIVRVPLAEATRELKMVPEERYAEAEVLFG